MAGDVCVGGDGTDLSTEENGGGKAAASSMMAMGIQAFLEESQRRFS